MKLKSAQVDQVLDKFPADEKRTSLRPREAQVADSIEIGTGARRHAEDLKQYLR